MHKEFEQSLNSKGWIFHCILCKESTSIYRERGIGERSPWRTKGQEGKGHLGMWRRLLKLSRRLSQSISSGTSEMTAINLLEENNQPSTVGRRVAAVDRCDGRPSESRLSIDGIPKSRRLSDFSCRPLSVLAVDRLRPLVDH